MFASTLLRRSLCLSALCSLATLLAACEHAAGGVCQSSRDCEDGLVCDTNLDETRGVCRDPGSIDAGTDAGNESDAAEPLRPDASPDAAAEDSGTPVLDAGSISDAGPVDSGAQTDDIDMDGGGDADGG